MWKERAEYSLGEARWEGLNSPLILDFEGGGTLQAKKCWQALDAANGKGTANPLELSEPNTALTVPGP